MDELLELSPETIAVSEKGNRGVHPGLRPDSCCPSGDIFTPMPPIPDTAGSTHYRKLDRQPQNNPNAEPSALDTGTFTGRADLAFCFG
jgi:hypothetical protein